MVRQAELFTPVWVVNIRNPLLIVILKLRLPVAQRDLVRLGDVIGLNRAQSFTEALASLSQQLERVGGGILGSAAIRISPMLLDEVSLKGRGDFVGRLECVVDGPVPCGVVNHVASIPRSPRYDLMGTPPSAASDP
jgi:hypothetical protein